MTPSRRSSSASRPTSPRTSSAPRSSASPGASSSPTRPSSAATASSTGRLPCSATSTTSSSWARSSCPASSPPRRRPPTRSRPAAATAPRRTTAATAASSSGWGWGTRPRASSSGTGDRRMLRMPTSDFLRFSAAVLCAVPGCDHLSCHGGPFLVVFVWTGIEQGQDGSWLWASVYSSETGAWGAATSAGNSGRYTVNPKQGTLVGNCIYFLLTKCSILKYDLGNHRLSVINWPGDPKICGLRVVLMLMEDGSLGLPGIWVSSLQLWSMNMDPKGVATWVHIRVIDLETTPVLPSGNPYRRADVIAFAEGVGIIFVTTNVAIFTIELKSGRIRKVCDLSYYSIVPFMSFYTPDCAGSRLPLPAEIN